MFGVFVAGVLVLKPLSFSSLALCLFGLFVIGCVHPKPPEKSSSVLYRDLQRLVSVENSKGWSIDRIELQELLSDALLSVCAVPVETRDELGKWLSKAELQLGGLPADVYKKNGQDLGGMGRLLEIHRVRLLLNTAVEQAQTDCPFWIQPDTNFRGLHLLDEQWILSLGGGGKLIGVKQGGDYDVNFGGAGRVLVGRGFAEHWALFAGMEFGGGAGFPKDVDGMRGKITILLDTVAQVTLRYQIVNSYFEFEGGYLTQTTETDLSEFSHGYRVGVAYGLQYIRQLLFLPSASFGVSYDHVYGNSTSSLDASYLKFGFRGVFDLTL